MNSYEKIYTLLDEGPKDWSEHEDTGEFQKIHKKIKRRKPRGTLGPKPPRPQERTSYDIAVTRGKIAQAKADDAVIKATGKKTR